jgi:hypothetical protein
MVFAHLKGDDRISSTSGREIGAGPDAYGALNLKLRLEIYAAAMWIC